MLSVWIHGFTYYNRRLMGGNNNTDGARRKRERHSKSNVTEQISRSCDETGRKRKHSVYERIRGRIQAKRG